MFQNILVPLDFSESSVRALRLAVKVARSSNGSLTLLHVGMVPAAVYGELGAYGFTPPADLLAAHERMVQEQEHVLRRIATEEIPTDVSWRVEMREGFAPEEIAAVLKEGEYDLLVMGTHGRTGLQRVMLGSVAERVLRQATVPVLVTH